MANDKLVNSRQQKSSIKEQPIKKQATPSQVRAKHEQQLAGGSHGKKKAGKKQQQQEEEEEEQQNDSHHRLALARENLDQNLSAYSRRAQEIKQQIGAALEQQAHLHLEPQASVGVEELRNSIAELAVVGDSRGELGEQVQQVVGESASMEIAQELTQPPTPPTQLDTSPEPAGNCFEPLTARLDPESKLVALRASLAQQFAGAPELLEPICKQFIQLISQIDSLKLYSEQQQGEIGKLREIKGRLGELCRELQRTNNEIRIENLQLIRGEQSKAKEQAGKIQSTLGGVMKLFDENQQRNLTLKQENLELQKRLKSLLEHCENWEKCVETTLKQRDIENKLIRTEMARLSLLRNEEEERFCVEKRELLRALEAMRGQQGKIEEKEAKLRSDLTNYASKYDECQEIISKGLSKFQLESKRMLKQIEKSRGDYIQLLGKYEASNKTIKKLLEEKQTWVQSMGASNKKLDTLERLCRSLKQENDQMRAKGLPDGAAS